MAAVEHDVTFCLEALEKALGHRGEFTGMLAVTGVRISMADRGRRIDNVFTSGESMR